MRDISQKDEMIYFRYILYLNHKEISFTISSRIAGIKKKSLTSFVSTAGLIYYLNLACKR